VSAAPPTTRCEYCRASVPADARYCLECGEGIRPYELLRGKQTVAVSGEGPAGETVVTRRGPGGGWLIPALLLLVLIGGLAAYALTRSDDNSASGTTGTGAITSTVTTSVTATNGTSPTTQTVTTATNGTGTETTPTDTTSPTDTTAPTDTSTTPGTTPPRPDDWTGTGYTVIVRSFPKDTKTQQDAISYQQGLGLTGSGVLDSNNFPDLRPGWWVVFVGKYSTADAANAAAAKLRGQGQTGAYARKVA
jgi:hypothetical protein